MTLESKIIQRQINYYNYVIQCIDLYLQKNIEPLQTFLNNLSRLNKGKLVFGDDFILLIDAYKNDDVKILQHFVYKFENILDNI